MIFTYFEIKPFFLGKTNFFKNKLTWKLCGAFSPIKTNEPPFFQN